MTLKEATQILELTSPFTKTDLKKAFRNALMVWHPDRFPEKTEVRAKAESRTYQINEAYAMLSRLSESDFPFRAAAADSKTSAKPPPSPHPPKNAPQAAPPDQQATNTPQPPQENEKSKTWLNVAAWLVGVPALIFLSSLFDSQSRPRPKTQVREQPAYQPPPALSASQTQRAIPNVTQASTNTETITGPSVEVKTSISVDELAKLKSELDVLVARRDAEFDRLQKWYEQGVAAADLPKYNAALQSAQRDELELEAKILAYNAKKKVRHEEPISLKSHTDLPGTDKRDDSSNNSFERLSKALSPPAAGAVFILDGIVAALKSKGKSVGEDCRKELMQVLIRASSERLNNTKCRAGLAAALEKYLTHSQADKISDFFETDIGARFILAVSNAFRSSPVEMQKVLELNFSTGEYDRIRAFLGTEEGRVFGLHSAAIAQEQRAVEQRNEAASNAILKAYEQEIEVILKKFGHD
jgi:curved DNA-binding protein CbpA